MAKKIDELKNMPSPDVYFKEIEQVGGITGQVYHTKFRTKEDYESFLLLEEEARQAVIKLKSKM
jgi:hypothetical protein